MSETNNEQSEIVRLAAEAGKAIEAANNALTEISNLRLQYDALETRVNEHTQAVNAELMAQGEAISDVVDAIVVLAEEEEIKETVEPPAAEQEEEEEKQPSPAHEPPEKRKRGWA